MKTKKVFILLGHPDKDSLNCALADEYQKGAEEAGHEVRRMNLGEMRFDPILHHGYRLIQELEPDLLLFQENIRWCEHFVLFYPSWWSTMPALLKGLFDRTWLPDFAFKFTHGGKMWRKLLKGRTARVFVSSDLHPLLARLIFGDGTNEIKTGILWFAGFNVRIKRIWPVRNISSERRTHWVEKFKKYGSRLY